ncbi:MAG: DUF2924 domain-containing protein [Candidatus Zixiibacteriota bacterium]
MTDKQDLEARIAAIETMDLAGLQKEYQALFGVEPVTKNVKALRGQITRKLQRQEIDARKKPGKAEAESPVPAPPAPAKAPKPKPAPESDTTVLKRIAELQGHSIPRLREEYERMYGRPCTSRNKRFLLKKIAEAVRGEVGAEAGKVTVTAKFERKSPSRSKRVTKPVKEKPESKRASFRESGERDPRLPKAGTTLTRHYKGKDILVRVLDDGFEWGGKQYRSLSAVAMAITGAKAINGFLFFELGDYAKKEKAAK